MALGKLVALALFALAVVGIGGAFFLEDVKGDSFFILLLISGLLIGVGLLMWMLDDPEMFRKICKIA